MRLRYRSPKKAMFVMAFALFLTAIFMITTCVIIPSFMVSLIFQMPFIPSIFLWIMISMSLSFLFDSMKYLSRVFKYRSENFKYRDLGKISYVIANLFIILGYIYVMVHFYNNMPILKRTLSLFMYSIFWFINMIIMRFIVEVINIRMFKPIKLNKKVVSVYNESDVVISEIEDCIDNNYEEYDYLRPCDC